MTFRPLPWLSVVTLISLILLISFGNWQMRRLEWKLNMIENVTARTDVPTRPIDDVLASYTSDDERAYWHVEAEGVFDHDKELHYYRVNVKTGAPGYNIITPLLREGKPPLLVNRGFVPLDQKDPATRQAGQVSGTVKVPGLIYIPGPQGTFVPDNQPAENMWFFYDLKAMRQAAGLPEVLPVILEADKGVGPAAGPEGGQTQLAFKNDHLSYALTWYGLAISLFVIYLIFHYKAGRLTIPWGIPAEH